MTALVTGVCHESLLTLCYVCSRCYKPVRAANYDQWCWWWLQSNRKASYLLPVFNTVINSSELVSEQILNGTSAQVGQETNQKQTLLNLSTTQKSKQHKTQQNKTSLVYSLLTWLFLQCSRAVLD